MSDDAISQIREEIHAVLKRYGAESDVTVYAVIGLLEVIKVDLLDMLTDATEDG